MNVTVGWDQGSLTNFILNQYHWNLGDLGDLGDPRNPGYHTPHLVQNHLCRGPILIEEGVFWRRHHRIAVFGGLGCQCSGGHGGQIGAEVAKMCPSFGPLH